MFTKKVLAFKISVNKITEIPKDKTTTNTLLLERVESEIDRPTMTGSSGSMHGASIVSTPAIKDIIKNVIVYLICPTREASVELPDHFLIKFPSLSTCTNVC